MKKNIFILIILLSLVVLSCNKTNNDTDLFDITEEETTKTEIVVEGNTEEDEENSSLLSRFPINYSEVNEKIDGIIKQRIISVIQFIGKYLMIAWAFFLTLPIWIKMIIYVTAIPAAITIIASQIIGIYRNRNVWQKHPGHELMYSYFVYSGNYRRKKSYKEARNLLYDKTQFWYSLAGLAYRLGNYSNTSSIIMFLLSFVYIPLTILGAIEMILRGIFGTIWFFVYNKMLQFLLFITRLISFLLIPVSKMIDKSLLKTQYCHDCYSAINLPYFVCPSCNTVHKELVPGRCGVLFVRCACNNKFLPCTSFTGRSNLVAKCTKCEIKLAAGNAKQFSISVVGGNDSGKTAFIAAFSKIYIEYINRTKHITVKGKPKEVFNKLYDTYNKGITESDTDPCTYSLVHKHGKSAKDNLVFYDTMDESIVSESYPRSPKYFGYCDGIILIIDPLSMKSVRDEVAETGNKKDLEEYSEDDIDSLVSQFVRLYFGIRGYSTGVLSEIPLAVVINKADINVIKQGIGQDVTDEISDQDHVCREYMTKIGLSNLLNNIDATFANVRFFSASAIGHTAQNGKAFSPIGVVSPIAWIAKQRSSRLLKYLKNINS